MDKTTNDENILLRIKMGIIFIFRFRRRPIQIAVLFPVGLSSFSRHFQQVLLGVEVSMKHNSLKGDDGETWKY